MDFTFEPVGDLSEAFKQENGLMRRGSVVEEGLGSTEERGG